MRHSTKTIGVLVLLAVVVPLAACSYSTDFVIVNNSTEVLKVEYRVKENPYEFAPPLTPATLPAAQLGSHETSDWTALDSTQYVLDPAQRTVTVVLFPGQALLVCRMHNYSGHGDTIKAKDFPLDQITLGGDRGVLSLTGDDARTTFSNSFKQVYVLAYPPE